MNDTMLRPPTDRSEVRRWSLSAAFVVAVHASVLAGGLFWYATTDTIGTGSQPMMVDLESAPPTDEPRKFDVAPGPDMQEAPAPAPEPEKQTKVEQEKIPPAPLQQNPVVLAPPEQREKPKPAKDRPKPIAEKPPQPSEEAPAPRTTAPPQAAQAARASYNGMLSAHLQRYKQYPPASRSAGEQGVAMLSFTVGRNGQVLSSSLAKSSGSAALDAETMAMIRRAQPLPAFLPGMTQSSLSFSVPVRFSVAN